VTKSKVAGVSIVLVDNSAGSPINMTAYIDTIESMGKEYMPLDVTTFADSAERVIAGIEAGMPISVSGPFDDTATTGPDAVFGTLPGAITSFEYAPIGTSSGKRRYLCEVLWLSYKVSGAVKDRVSYVLTGTKDGTMLSTVY
jgi:hypothetical protein